MNFNRLRFVAERAEIGEDREALFSVIIPEKPERLVFLFPFPFFASFSDDIFFFFTFQSFQTLHSVIHPRNVTEFSYRYSSADRAVVFVGEFQREGEKTNKIKQIKQNYKQKK